MTRAVFFDAGHTLIHAYPDLGSVYAQTTASQFGRVIDPERFVEAFIPVFRDSTRRYAASSSASDEQDLEMWRSITRDIYDRIPALRPIAFDRWFGALYERFGQAEVWRFYDDVAPVLRDLRAKGLKLGIISNWDTRLKKVCDGLGLTPMVDFLVISAEAGIRKPDPRIFHLALEKAGVRPEEAIHVGDLPEEDAEGARRAGVRPILIDRKMRVTATAFPEGFQVVQSLTAVLDLV